MKVAVVARPGSDLVELYRRLANPALFVVRTFCRLEEIREGLPGFQFDVLIMNFDNFDEASVQVMVKLRAHFPHAGLVVLASKAHPGARYKMRDVPQSFVLQAPYELDDLSKVLQKMRSGRCHRLRLHPRVQRTGDCQLVLATGETKGVVIGRFLDYSQMGARLVVFPREPLLKNAEVQLFYSSTSEPGRTQKILAKVAWGEVASGIFGTMVRGPEQIVGVRFVAAL